jgi:Core-2/I-Branching enzyme
LTVDESPFRVAYLVLSHQRPRQIEALTDRILALSPNGHVVVHHDLTATELPWSGQPPARVHLVERMEVTWGDWSIVEASLRLLRFASEALDADWYVFLSGDDRPVMDLARWERDVQMAGHDGLVPARPLNRKPAFGRRPTFEDLNYVRYAYRWRPIPQVHGVARLLVELARRVSRVSQPLFKIEYAPRRDQFFLGLPRRRRLPAGWTLYAGKQWVALGRRAAEALLHADASVTEWYRQTWIPDQSFIHTVLHNHPGLTLSPIPLTYVVPYNTKMRRGDMALRVDDLDAIHRSGASFARKFDPSVDPDVLRAVDDEIDSPQP